ncbi:MAG TPA: hypothetical protein VL485_03820 [Ktedonobacteraceae bacterium]|nr:hypothetical protein [Ktedonobacteraceae bacterium]
MPDEHTQRSTSHEPTNLLQNRPQRRSRRGPAALLLRLGGVIIVCVIAIVTWQALAQHTPSPGSSAPGTNVPTKGNDNGNAVPPGWNDPAIYWQTIRTQVAQGLHLSEAQISAQLQAAGATSTATPVSTSKDAAPDPGAPMANLAAQQGISTDQLRTLELNALQTACHTLVTQGKLTQADEDQRMQVFRGWDQGTLNWYVMHAFTGQ